MVNQPHARAGLLEMNDWFQRRAQMRLRHFQRKRGVVISLIIEQKRREADHAVPVGQMIEMPETFGRVRKKREIRLDAEGFDQAQRRRIADIK